MTLWLPIGLWVALILLSIVPAYAIYKGIGKAGENYARLEGKHFQFGGAAAFYIFLLILGKSFIPTIDQVKLTHDLAGLQTKLEKTTIEKCDLEEKLGESSALWKIEGKVQLSRQLFNPGANSVAIIIFKDKPETPYPESSDVAKFEIHARQIEAGAFPTIYVWPLCDSHFGKNLNIVELEKKGEIERDAHSKTLKIVKKIELEPVPEGYGK